MLFRVARWYLLLLFAATAGLSAFSFGVSIATLLLPATLPDLYSTRLGIATLLAGILVLPLAQDRNIWAHEVRLCPRPLQIGVRLGFFYALLGIAYGIFTRSFALGGPAFCTGFTLGLVCILYAILWADSSQPADLLGKIAISFVGICIFAGIYWADRSGYWPHTHPL